MTTAHYELQGVIEDRIAADPDDCGGVPVAVVRAIVERTLREVEQLTDSGWHTCQHCGTAYLDKDALPSDLCLTCVRTCVKR